MRKVYQLSLILLFFSFSTSLFSHDGIKKGFHFTENKGQHGDNVAFHSKLHVGNMFLEKDRFTFDLFSAEEMNTLFDIKHTSREEKNGIPQIQKRQPKINPSEIDEKFKKHSYSMVFNGSNSNPSIIPDLILSGTKNYFIGNDESKWGYEAKSYKSVKYNGLYNNIDMEIYSEFEWMKYDFIVHPGGNPNDIQINYEGVDGLRVNAKGELIIELSTGEIKEVKLKAYQDINGKRISVPCFFNKNGKQISYNLPDGYNTNFDLIIDPIWIFSSLSGSTADNWGFTSTYDTLGNLYSAGIAFGNGYPTTVGAYSTTSLGGDFDISITKFDPTGANVLYATYLGGNDNEMPHSLVHDSQNNLVLLGSSSSTNYPTSSGGFDQTFNGGWGGTSANMWGSPYSNGADIVLTKLNGSGNIINSTYIGGSDNEGINESMVYNYADQGRGELVLDANDNVYVATSLWSDDFPGISGGAINNGAGWGTQDAVVFKMNSSLSSLDWARYLGGSDFECGNSIRVSDQGTVFVCGATTSSDLGATGGVYDQTFNGVWDGYIASFNANTGAPIARTYIGTADYDQTFILEVDDLEDVYVVGQTLGSYPVVNAAYSNANSSQFIHKLNSSLSTTDYSTVFGSGSTASINISPTAFLVDKCGNVYVSGWGGGFNNAASLSGVYNPFAGGSTNGLPLTVDAQQSSTDGSDFYFFVLERDATGLLYGTYFGDPNVAEHTDGGTSRFDPDGVVYQSVCAACDNPWTFPTTPGVAYPNSGTAGQAFFCNMGSIKFEFDFQGVEATANVPANITMCTNDYSVDFTSTGTNPQHFWDFGDGSGTSSAANPTYTYATVGTYNVMYVAIDPSSCNISDTAYFSVELIQAPTFNANFNLPNIPPCSDPATVTVNANVSGTGIDSLQWDMGDGTIYTDINSISHSYTSQGIYPIEVIAWDLTCGFSDTIVDTLNFITAVSNAVATAPADTTLCSFPPYNMNFTSDGSTPSVFWDFGDGNTSTLPNPTNAFADSGTYQVMFIAIDPNTCNLEDTAYFTVELLQAATFSAQISVPTIPPCSDPTLIPLNASFTGSGADSLVWDLGDGTIYTDSSSFTYYYSTPGVYTVSMTAWDLTCNNTNTISQVVDFNSTFSTATATVPPDTLLCSSPPFNMDFTSNGSTPDVFWDFGDGNTSTLPNPNNAFADSGTYQVMFVAIDSTTCNIADTAYFTVDLQQAAVFNAQFNVPTIPPCSDPTLIPLNASFTGTGADSLVWDLGDGTIYTDSTSFTYYYANSGIYTVSMTAWDFTCNNTNTISQVVNFNSTFSTATATVPPDTLLCSSPPFNMDFTSNGSTPDVFWDFGDGNTSTLPNPTNAFADSGIYQVMFVAIDSTTCNIADTAYFTVDLQQAAVFNAQFNVPTIPPCSDPTLIPLNASFTGTGADSLVWDLGDGTIYTDSTSFTYYYATSGIYTVSMTAWDFTCNNTNTVSQVVNFTSSFSTATATAPNDTTICSTPPYNMDFTSDGSTPDVFWNFGDGNTSTLPNPTNAFADSGFYQVMFIAIDSTTCNIADTAYFDVEIIQAPTFIASFNLPVIPPCSDPDSVTVNANFSGSGIDSLVWDMGDGTQIFDSTSIAYNYTAEGIYNISVSAWGFCGNDTTISEVFNFNTDSSLAVAYAPEDTLLCTTPPFDIGFNSYGSNPSQLWDFGDGNTSTDPNPNHVFADTGNYVVTYIAIDSSSCNISDTVEFNVTLLQAEQFSAELNFDPPPPCGIDSMLVELAFTGTGADSLIWDMGNGDVFNDSNVNYYYTVPGTYQVALTAYDLECDYTETISEAVVFAGNFNTEDVVPNVFSPNGDGDNDQLRFIRVNDTEQFKITIYNRWGAVIYESTNANVSWDGNSPGGKLATAGVYFFEIRYTDKCSEDEKLETGFIHLVR